MPQSFTPEATATLEAFIYILPASEPDPIAAVDSVSVIWAFAEIYGDKAGARFSKGTSAGSIGTSFVLVELEHVFSAV